MVTQNRTLATRINWFGYRTEWPKALGDKEEGRKLKRTTENHVVENRRVRLGTRAGWP